MHDVFISYSSKDQRVADAIINILESKRIKCWIAYRDTTAGDDYAASIVRAIKNSKACVLIFSSESNQSKHVLNEINSCVNYSVAIIPFKISDVLMHDSLEYYLGRTHWLDAMTDPLEEHIHKLAARLESFVSIETHIIPMSSQGRENLQIEGTTEHSKSEPRMVKYSELIQLGYTADKIAIQLVENDYVNYNGISEDNEGTPAQWAQFIQNSTETFQYLLNSEDKIVGDWSIVALNEADFDKAKTGQLLEKDIDFNSCEIISFPDTYYGYILVFSLLPDYRSQKNYMLILNSFYKQIEEYAENGVFFKEWCINVFTPEIENMVKKMGFKYLANNITLGKIYHQNFMPLPENKMISQYPKMIKLYSEAAE